MRAFGVSWRNKVAQCNCIGAWRECCETAFVSPIAAARGIPLTTAGKWSRKEAQVGDRQCKQSRDMPVMTVSMNPHSAFAQLPFDRHGLLVFQVENQTVADTLLCKSCNADVSRDVMLADLIEHLVHIFSVADCCINHGNPILWTSRNSKS